MSLVRKSVLLSLGQNYIGFALQLLSSIIISRLLTPAEIGIFSVAMVLIGFAHTLRDFGVGSYIVQEKELTQDKIRSAFAITLITAWLMATLIIIGSGYAAEFYHEPGIRSVMLVISLNFILIPFGVVPIAYMNRQMDFMHVALIRTIASIVSTVFSIGLAYMGFSYLSMAWGSVAGIICTIVLVLIWRPKGLPMLPGFREIRKVISFGLLFNLIMVLNDLRQGAPEMILGRLSGMAVVGYFGRAMSLLTMFEKFVLSALWSVALAHFAKQSINESTVKVNFLRSMTYITVLAWPFFVCLGILAHPIILILYGKQWEASVPLLRLLCLSAIITSPFMLMGSMLTAIGQIKQNAYLLAVDVPIRIMLIFLAAPLGLEAVGVSFIFASLVDNIVCMLQCNKVLFVNLKEIARALYQSAGVTITAAILPFAIFLLGEGVLAQKLWLQLLIGMATAMLGWLAGLFLFRHPFRGEIRNSFLIFKKSRKPPTLQDGVV